jgi:hypothetical protein
LGSLSTEKEDSERKQKSFKHLPRLTLQLADVALRLSRWVHEVSGCARLIKQSTDGIECRVSQWG